jgi:hypothetical protein
MEPRETASIAEASTCSGEREPLSFVQAPLTEQFDEGGSDTGVGEIARETEIID